MNDISCVVASNDALGESCLWCPTTRKVWWLDILRPCLQSFDPATGRHEIYTLPGRNCGNVALRRAGGFVLAMDSGLHGFDPATGKTEFLLHPEADAPDNRYNDGRCDRRGRLWIGTMDCEIRKASGRFYRIGPHGTVLTLFDGISVPNSTAFSPDDSTMYFADTPLHTIWAFDFDIDAGMISNRRVFADLGYRNGLPDGSCVDADGYLWNCEYAGHRVVRYAPNGRVDRSIELPVTNPTCCCFGGDNLDTLYITSAVQRLTPEQMRRHDGGLLAVAVGVRGLPEAAYWG
jgi:sugar lactone lactonase YvrE